MKNDNVKYSVLITTFDKRFKNHFVPLLKEIKRQRPNLEVIVGVNGNYKKKFDEKYIKNILIEISKYENVFPQVYTKFTSLAKQWNRGVLNSSNDLVLILNDDVTIKDGFFDFLDNQVDLTTEKGYIVLNKHFAHFFINKNFLASINWFDERYMGIGWEDFDVDRNKVSRTTVKTKLIVHNFDTKPMQENLTGAGSGAEKYTKFNKDFYHSKWKNGGKEEVQYPYFNFEVENYDKL